MTHISSPPVLLAFAPDKGKKWVHVATAGTYAGYKGGLKPFEFTRQTFETILANFHAHPQYQRGPVVPYDYEHASEHGLSIPGVAQHGTPACGWVYDLEIRESGGTSQLWALSELGMTAKEQVRAGEYRWTSVAVQPAFVNPVSGLNQGPTLTSIALTNKPFLQGLEPIAASIAASQGGGIDVQQVALRTIDAINSQPGFNEIAKANNYLKANVPEHDSLHLVEQIRIAGDFVRDVCNAASFPVKLTAAPAESKAAPLASPAAQYPGLDQASITLNAIALMSGGSEIERATAFLAGSSPSTLKDMPIAEQFQVAAFYLKNLKESAHVV